MPTTYTSAWVYEKDAEGETDVIVFEPEKRAESETAPSSVLHEAKEPQFRGNPIARLASSRFWVYSDTPISELVEALTPLEDLFSVGIVDADGDAIGLIIRRELFDLLGRAYGRELVEKSSVRSVVRFAKSFSPDANVLAVADLVSEDMKSPLIRYFLLKDADGHFAGIFSTKDMLIHLSGMLRRDIATVRNFQSKVVLGSSCLTKGRLSVAGFSRPAKDAGGDYYAFRELPDGTVLALLADVSGKGVGASYLTAACAAVADSFDFSRGFSAYLATLNRHLAHRYGETGSFLTCVALLADPETGLVRACDLGHSYLFLVRGNSHTKVALPACPPLGIDADLQPQIARFQLEAGDSLLTVTDGVSEQRGHDGEEFGTDTTIKAIGSLADLSQMREAILGQLDAFRGGQPQHDDITALALRWS